MKIAEFIQANLMNVKEDRLNLKTMKLVMDLYLLNNYNLSNNIH